MHQAVKRSRRILIVAPDFYPANGGYSNAITNLVRYLLKSGESKVTVVTLIPLGDKDELEIGNLRIKRLAKFSGFIRYNAIIDQIKLGRIVKEYIISDEFDFVLFETFENPLALWIATRGLGKERLRKIAVRIHATTETETFLYSRLLTNRVYWNIVKRLVRRLPNILSTTQHYIEFIKQYSLDNNVFDTFKNYGVIPNIVDAVPVQDMEHVQPQGEQIYTFFALGRMNGYGYNQKNFELIVQAMYILKSQNESLYRKISIVVVGEGSWSSKFRKILCDLDIKEQFVLEESKSYESVRLLQATAHAVILVSRFEGQSMFAMESLAAGAPLIVSSGTGVSNLVIHGENGFLINPDDPYSLTEAMINICNADLDVFRAKSRKIYENHYKPSDIIEKLFAYIDFCSSSAKVYASLK